MRINKILKRKHASENAVIHEEKRNGLWGEIGGLISKPFIHEMPHKTKEKNCEKERYGPRIVQTIDQHTPRLVFAFLKIFGKERQLCYRPVANETTDNVVHTCLGLSVKGSLIRIGTGSAEQRVMWKASSLLASSSVTRWCPSSAGRRRPDCERSGAWGRHTIHWALARPTKDPEVVVTVTCAPRRSLTSQRCGGDQLRRKRV